MPAAASLELGGLPIGLASGVTLKQAVTQGAPIRWQDVDIDESTQAARVRRQMEASAGARRAA